MTFKIEAGPASAPYHLILAHGAGAGVSSPFFAAMSELLGARGLRVTCFEFAYMEQRRDGGKRRPPPRMEKLFPEYLDVVREIAQQANGAQTIVIGGKSMGGRVASMIADDLYDQRQIAGLVCLGYPFHPPGKPEALRTDHLVSLKTPALIAQGERDPFGNQSEIEAMTLSSSIAFRWIGDGDHDFGPRGASGFTRKGNLAEAADAVAAFVLGLDSVR